MKRILAGLGLAVVFSAGPVFADDLGDVDKMMKEKVNAVISILRDKDSDQDLRKQEIITIVESAFDFNLMARLSLGKTHWSELKTPAEREKYTTLFVRRIQDSYLDKMNLYSDEIVKFEPAMMQGKRIQLQTHLVSDSNNISILYKLYQSKKGWRVYDLEIQGVSFVQTYRKQFEGVLNTGTVQDLIKKLENPDQFTIETPGEKQPAGS
ncbi:MAG TPA: ABC transporter substrate-binding protein [Nitrospiria bacterium]